MLTTYLQPLRSRSASLIGYKITEMLRGVSRRVQSLEFNVANFESVSVMQPGDIR